MNKTTIAMVWLGAVVFGFANAAFSWAAEGESGDAVVVTARRGEQPLVETIQHTTVITQRQIRESQAVDLPSLLRKEAGVEFLQQGGTGSVSSLFIRGTGSTQSLILIDGVKVSSLTTGRTAIDQIMLDQIERIEIVRGNVSSLYGSEAIGGVIQVFTRKGHGAPGMSLYAGGGSQATGRVAFGYGGETDRTQYALHVSGFNTAGFSALRPGASPTADPDRDGYRNQSLSANISHFWAPDQKLGLTHFGSVGRVHYDDAFASAITDKQTADTRVSASSLVSHNRITDRWLSRVTLSQGEDINDTYLNAASNARVKSVTQQAAWQNDFNLAPDHRLALGLDHSRMNVSSTTAYARTARSVDGLFASYAGRIGAHSLQINGREERYSDFGRVGTYLAGYGLDLTTEWRATASASTAFRAPNVNELYYPFGVGNPNLKPERAKTGELGLQFRSAGHLLRAAVFHTRIEDMIQVFPIINIDKAVIDGAELSYTGRLGDTDIAASLTIQDPRDGLTQAPLIRRAKRFGSLSASHSWGRVRMGMEVLASGDRQDNHLTAFPTERVLLAGYEVLNLIASYRYDDMTRVSVRLDNAFNQDYSLAHGYNSRPRTLFAALEYRY